MVSLTLNSCNSNTISFQNYFFDSEGAYTSIGGFTEIGQTITYILDKDIVEIRLLNQISNDAFSITFRVDSYLGGLINDVNKNINNIIAEQKTLHSDFYQSELLLDLEGFYKLDGSAYVYPKWKRTDILDLPLDVKEFKYSSFGFKGASAIVFYDADGIWIKSYEFSATSAATMLINGIIPDGAKKYACSCYEGGYPLLYFPTKIV